MQATFVCFKPDGQRKDVPMTTSTIVFGRRDDCDVRVALGPVSRRHCEVALEGETLTVKDLDSSNGTFVNGRQITQQALKAGDQLQVGGVTFTVQIDGQPADIQPSAAVATPAAEAELALSPDDTDVTPALATEATDDVDPISALEALADAQDEEKT